jgi:hypothetical protein
MQVTDDFIAAEIRHSRTGGVTRKYTKAPKQPAQGENQHLRQALAKGELLAFSLGDLLATIEARSRHVMAQVNFASRRLHSQRRASQEIM